MEFRGKGRDVPYRNRALVKDGEGVHRRRSEQGTSIK